MTEWDVHEEEVGIKTVTVRSDEEYDFEELNAGEIRPVAETVTPPVAEAGSPPNLPARKT